MKHNLVLHSVSYSGSWGQHFLSLEQFLDKAAELGFDGVMLMAKRPHLSVLDWPAAARARLRSQVEKLGLRVACIAGYTNFTGDLEHRDIPNREYQIRHVVELAEMARDLGCGLVRIFTGYEQSSTTLDAQWKLIVESLRECSERTAELGVTIGVQNHHDIACDFESLYELIQEVNAPNCRAMFDAWAPALQGVDLATAAARMAKITVYTTTANYALRPRFRYHPTLVNYEKLLPTVQAVPMDEGFIDYRCFLAQMEAGGFEGPVAYEMCSPLRGGGGIENLDFYGRKFVSFMRAGRGSVSSGAGC
ncbi:MAG TPA: sugar phosphate isomerase/epimerase family protein [Bryobacteraceae bacterium]|jgi:sugar phosphate isomerase/epimerase|nr:sugar phosphate isomerase/epimerase family protein [Bryobacteraceae bacterium]